MTPRLPAVTPRQAVRALERCGWKLDRVKGATTSSGTPTTLIGSSFRCTAATWPRETLNQIVNASGLDRAEFLELL